MRIDLKFKNFRNKATSHRALAVAETFVNHVLEAVIERAARDGLETDLVYLRTENGTHRARLLYRLDPAGGMPRYRLEVSEKAMGRVAERELDVRPVGELWLGYRFGKLQSTKKEVRIRARKGERAELWLRNRPRSSGTVATLPKLAWTPNMGS